MCGSLGLDQLPGQAQLVARPAHASLKHVAYAQFPADSSHVDRPTLVDERRIARYNEQPLDTGKAGDDLLDDPVSEILLLSMTTQVVERQHSDRRPIPRDSRQRWLCWPWDGHVSDKAETLARQGADQALCLAGVANRCARRVYPARQGRFRDDPSTPDRVQQVVLGDDVLAIANQKDQQVEDLRFHCDRFAASPQFAERHVKHVIGKAKLHLDAP
jgi:hypothetical protein